MKKQHLRRLIKFAIQPLFHPRVPFSLRRKLMKSAALLQRKQKGVQRDELVLGGVPTYQATAKYPGRLHVLYLHGGGYVFGDVSTHRQVVDGIAVIGHATVWMPHYRLAPEKPFPAALDDAVATYEALLDKAIDPADIIVAGDSAGGGLSVALAVRLRDQGLPLPRGLALFSPWVDLTITRASHLGNAAIDPMLLPSGLQSCAAAYCGETPRDHPLCSPLFADLQGLPRMLIQVGTDEILFDDAVELHKAAMKAGVAADLQVFEGLWHVFQLHCHQLPEATQAVKQALQAFSDK